MYLERAAFVAVWGAFGFAGLMAVAGWRLTQSLREVAFYSTDGAEAAHSAQWMYLVGVAGFVGCGGVLTFWNAVKGE